MSARAEKIWFVIIVGLTATVLAGYAFSWKNYFAKPSSTPASTVARVEPKVVATSALTKPAPAAETPHTFSVEPVARALREREAALRESSSQNIYPRSVRSVLEGQIELARRGFSSGAIDGIAGGQTTAAIQAFQASQGLAVNGTLDPATLEHLIISSPPTGERAISAADLARLQPLSLTWLGKSQQDALEYETALELMAERYHAHPNLLRQLNPSIDWENIAPDTVLTVPLVERVLAGIKAARVRIGLAEHFLEAFDSNGTILAHFPVSIARNVEKRPVGELHVTVVIPNPNYTFNPEVFPESDEGRQLGRSLVVPPGPNNPVGLAWIGLDRPGYGMHGTPSPEQVGRTESHGCFRLANWDALALLDMAWVGMPVVVEP